MHQHEFGRSNV